jgi:D-alanine transaminase
MQSNFGTPNVVTGLLAAAVVAVVILGGITRDLLKELMVGAGIDCRDEPVTEAALRAAREIWVSSSTKEVTPVVRLDGKPVGEGTPGPLWERVRGLFQDYKQRLMRGDAD